MNHLFLNHRTKFVYPACLNIFVENVLNACLNFIADK